MRKQLNNKRWDNQSENPEIDLRNIKALIDSLRKSGLSFKEIIIPHNSFWTAVIKRLQKDIKQAKQDEKQRRVNVK